MVRFAEERDIPRINELRRQVSELHAQKGGFPARREASFRISKPISCCTPRSPAPAGP